MNWAGATAVRPYALAAVFLLALLPFAGSLRYGYTNWDDPSYTYESPLHGELTLSSAAGAFTRTRLSNYHPLTEIELAAESAIFGDGPATHRAAGLILHGLNAVLLCLLLTALGAGALPAAAAAALWAVHPAQAESAAWIAERKNLLYAFFYFSALLAYLRGLRSGGRWTAVAFALALLSSLSKAAAVTFPLALLLIELRFPEGDSRRRIARLAPFFLLAAATAAAASAAQGAGGSITAGNPLHLLSFYLRSVFLPFGLSPVYPYHETLASFSASPLLWAVPGLVFAAAGAMLVRSGSPAAWGVIFFVVHLLPHLVLVPSGNIMAADRYLYMPLAGLAAAAALAFPVRGLPRAAALAACAAAIPLFSFFAARHAADWKDSFSLWTRVLSFYPDDETANLNMGSALAADGDLAGAEAHFSAALARNPGGAKALYNLGTLLAMRGDPRGEALLSRSASLDPSNHMAAHNLGLINLRAGRHDAAAAFFDAALQASPSYPPSLAGMARARLAAGDCGGARRAWEAARTAGEPGDPVFSERLEACR